jgi:hypothetical protein
LTVLPTDPEKLPGHRGVFLTAPVFYSTDPTVLPGDRGIFPDGPVVLPPDPVNAPDDYCKNSLDQAITFTPSE